VPAPQPKTGCDHVGQSQARGRSSEPATSTATGMSDILWTDGSGTHANWKMSGTTFSIPVPPELIGSRSVAPINRRLYGDQMSGLLFVAATHLGIASQSAGSALSSRNDPSSADVPGKIEPTHPTPFKQKAEELTTRQYRPRGALQRPGSPARTGVGFPNCLRD
jgi:hypothetical protein